MHAIEVVKNNAQGARHMADSCTVKIFGRVSGVRATDGTLVAVPFGIYTMEELSLGRYRLSGKGLPTIELQLSDIATHMGSRMTVIDGQWRDQS